MQTEALDFITFNLKFCAAAGAFAIFSGSRRRESGGGRMGTTSLKRARVRTGLAEPEQQRNPEHVLVAIRRNNFARLRLESGVHAVYL